MFSGFTGKETNQEAIERLRETLEYAESGELQSFALVGFTRAKGDITTYSFRSGELLAFIGALEALKLELLDINCDEDIGIDLPLSDVEVEDLEQ